MSNNRLNSLVPVSSSIEKRIADGITISLFFFIIPYTSFIVLKNKNLAWYYKILHCFFIFYFPYIVISGTVYTLFGSMIILFVLGFFKIFKLDDFKQKQFVKEVPCYKPLKKSIDRI